MRKLLCSLFVCFMIFPGVDGQSGTDVKTLLTQLFTTNGYNKYVPPTTDLTQPIEIDLDLVLVGINELNELDQKLVTTGYLMITWKDAFLTWSMASYNNLEYFLISQKEIWLPDIALENGFNKLDRLGNDFMLARVQYEGYVEWRPSEVFQTKCSINIRYFPFDVQTCNIVFVVWGSTSSDIKVTLWNNGIILDEFEQDGAWSIIDTSATESSFGVETKTTFKLVLKRQPTYYLINLIFPIILLSLLTVFTFALPADSGEKMGYSMTVFLSFAVFLTIMTAELPKVSGAILGYYMVFELAMGTFIVCFTALELRLHHRKDPVPDRVQKIFKFKCRKCKKGKSDVNPHSFIETKTENCQESDIAWDDVVSKIDLYMFWIMLLITIAATVGFMLVLITAN